jgi:DNA-binding response OmpR family regulator
MRDRLTSPPQRDPPATQAPEGAALPRILVADDEDGTLTLLTTALTFAGYAVIAARDGLEAIRLARAAPPDLALLDVMMPGMDGREVCRRMGSDPALTNVPVILHSSADEQDIDWRGCGADAFLAKPFSIRELPALIEHHLHAHAGDNRRVAHRLTDAEVRRLALRIRQAVRQAPGPDSGTDVLSLHRELSPEDEGRLEAALVALLGKPDIGAKPVKTLPGKRQSKRRSRRRRPDEGADD